MADRRNNIPVLLPERIVKVKKYSPIIGRLHVIADIPFPVRKASRRFRRKECQIQFTRRHLERLCVVIADNLKYHLVDVGRPLEIVLIFCQDDGLPHIPAFQLIRPGSHRRTEKIGSLHILPRKQMLRKNCHRHVVQKGHIRCRQAEGNRVLIRHRDLLHILKVGGVLGSVFRIHHRFYGKLHILRRKRLTVMPDNALLQMKGVSAGRLIKLPALCQAGRYLIFSVVGSQPVKQQQVDLPVLIQRRIDACVVPAAVD